MDVNFRDRFLALQRLEMAEQKLACATGRASRTQAVKRFERRTTAGSCKTRRSRRPATALGCGAQA
jgi:hypothetical protein